MTELTSEIRESLAKVSGGDLRKIAAAAKARQAAGERKVVRLPPKRVRKTKKAS